jgi:hypothetical protein
MKGAPPVRCTVVLLREGRCAVDKVQDCDVSAHASVAQLQDEVRRLANTERGLLCFQGTRQLAPETPLGSLRARGRERVLIVCVPRDACLCEDCNRRSAEYARRCVRVLAQRERRDPAGFARYLEESATRAHCEEDGNCEKPARPSASKCAAKTDEASEVASSGPSSPQNGPKRARRHRRRAKQDGAADPARDLVPLSYLVHAPAPPTAGSAAAAAAAAAAADALDCDCADCADASTVEALLLATRLELLREQRGRAAAASDAQWRQVLGQTGDMSDTD